MVAQLDALSAYYKALYGNTAEIDTPERDALRKEIAQLDGAFIISSKGIVEAACRTLASTAKNITPHKLRSTYGTNLYRATGDIYLVADVLGHSDVNTTKKHYAAIDDDIRRKARDQVKLRKD